MLEPCNHKFHNECIIKSLRINGPRCPLCRGVDIHLNNNSSESNIHFNNYNYEFNIWQENYNPPNSYFENTNVTNPIIYDNIVYDFAGNDVTGYVNSVTFNDGRITYVPTITISSESTSITNNE